MAHLYLSLVRRKPVCVIWTTSKVQVSLRIHAVWSVPLLFTSLIVHHLYLLSPKFQDSSESLKLNRLVWVSLVCCDDICLIYGLLLSMMNWCKGLPSETQANKFLWSWMCCGYVQTIKLSHQHFMKKVRVYCIQVLQSISQFCHSFSLLVSPSVATATA